MTRLFAAFLTIALIAPAAAETTIPAAKPTPYKFAPIKSCDWKADTLSSFGACTGDGDKTPTRLRATSRGLELMPEKGGKAGSSGNVGY